MNVKVSKNINILICFNFFYMFLVIVPVLVPYFTFLGLTMSQILIVQAIFGIVMAIFEIPSAYIGDLFGRKAVLCLGSFISMTGFLFLLRADNFYSLVIYEVLLGVGASFVSGADLSLLFDSIENDRQLIVKTLSSFQSAALIGEALAALLCGIIVVYSFKYVIYLQVFVGCIPFFISLFLVESDYVKMNTTSHMKNFRELFGFIFKDEIILRQIFINMTICSLSTFFAIWTIQKYWSDNGLELSQIGYFWMVCNLLAALTGKVASRIETKIGTLWVLFLISILPVVAYITMGLTQSVVGLMSVLLFYISRGLNMVVYKEAFNHRIPTKFRNTANSISSFVFRVSFFIFAPLIGYSIDTVGMSLTFIYLSILFISLFFIFCIPFLISLRKFNP